MEEKTIMGFDKEEMKILADLQFRIKNENSLADKVSWLRDERYVGVVLKLVENL